MSRWREVVGQCAGFAGSGLVRTRHAGGHVEMLQALPWLGWRAARLSRGCHQRRETWWYRGRCAATIYARRREYARWGSGWNGLAVTGGQRLWWGSWPGRCWGNDREKP